MSASSDGATKMRATISLSSPTACTTGATFFTSSADSQLMMAPSPSRPARRSMPSRSAATRIGGCSGTHAEPEPVHRERVVGLGDLLAGERGAQEPHHVARLLVRLLERDAVPALDDDVRRGADAEHEPPGAAWASEPTLWARQPGPRVKAGTMAVPRRSVGAHTDARVSGVNASAPSASADHTSV